MAHIQGSDRDQLLLLPDVIDDYVGADNLVRFIDAFVDQLDLAAAGFARVMPEVRGRPGYNPADLLKLYIYGYLNRIRSSRRLEVETHRNIEVIWLLRRLKPDFKTIADFRKDNRNAFKAVFREFVSLCRDLDLFGCELVAVDGSRIKAVNRKDRNFTKASLKREIAASDERLERYLKELDETDKGDHSKDGRDIDRLQEKIASIKERREGLREHAKTLEESGEDQLSLTDPDARAMHSSTRVGVGYNVQIAVDVENKLIAEAEVHSKVSDLGLLTETAEVAKEALSVATIDVVADRGYFKIEDIEACEKAGVTPYVPKPRRSPAATKGLFPKDRFRYDPDHDHYTCPGGQHLTRYYTTPVRDTQTISYANRPVCKSCSLKAECTGATYRQIVRYENEAVLERMAERLVARPEIMDQRRKTVEHPFGSIKQWMYQGAFLMKRLENVRGEFSLTALAYNIRRAITLVGIPGLIAAVKA